MNKRIILFFGILAILLVGALAISSRPTGPPKRDAVAVTTFPLYDLVRNIAPEDIEVILILPPGASPHTFEPTPSTIRSLERSKVLFAVGHGLDDWTAELATASGTPVVNSYSGLKLREYDDEKEDGHGHEEAHEEGEEHDHHHEGVDPHYWLSVPNAIAMTATITVELTAYFPEHRDDMSTRHNSILGRLRDADYMIRQELEGLSSRKIVTLHDAWYYFAEEYGLELVASFEPAPGREPTPQYLVELGHAVKDAGVKTIYSEPQLSTASLESFIDDHGLHVAVLDPLGGTEGRASYIEMMLYNARTITQNQ